MVEDLVRFGQEKNDHSGRKESLDMIASNIKPNNIEQNQINNDSNPKPLYSPDSNGGKWMGDNLSYALDKRCAILRIKRADDEV